MHETALNRVAMASPSARGYDSPLARTPSRGSQGSTTPGTSSRSGRTVLSDKYVLGEELGRGAFGQVQPLAAVLFELCRFVKSGVSSLKRLLSGSVSGTSRLTTSVTLCRRCAAWLVPYEINRTAEASVT